MADHHLDASVVHPYWDNAEPPRLEIEPGDTVTFECRDALDGQIGPDDGSDALGAVDASRVHPLAGPVFVRGAEPGDALEVEILDFEIPDWGWNGFSPGFGLLADEFDHVYLQHWRIANGVCRFADDDRVAVPLEPFCGVMGVAPAEAGRLDTAPPRRNGGNIDIRGLGVGAKLYQPVLVPGALFSVGDGHAAQGDGEVCGTGIEIAMTVALRFGLRKGLELAALRFTTPSPLTRADLSGYMCTTGHGPDLHENARTATRDMVDWLESGYGLSRAQAYCLCSAAADLKISEIVDAPNWLVSCYLPRSVLVG